MVTGATPYIPERRDVVYLDFDPQTGREQKGRRPALVLSPLSYNRRVGLCVACPITNQAKGYPFEVAIPSGYKVTGVILADQVKSLDWQARNASLLDHLPQSVLDDVLAKIDVLLK
jgi:mRNA interferase MazF